MSGVTNILVAVDLAEGDRLVGDGPTEASRQALEVGLWLAARHNARIVMMAVLDVSPLAKHQMEQLGVVRPKLLDAAERLLQPYLVRAQEFNVASHIVIQCGSPRHEILSRVQVDDHDLLLLGGAQKEAFASMRLGGTALQLLRTCPCPVWVVPSAGFQDSMNVLVAVDFSPTSEVALAIGGMLATDAQRTLQLLHVAPGAVAELETPASSDPVTVATESPATESPDADDRLRSDADIHAALADLARPWAEQGVATKTTVRYGRPEDVILEVVQEDQIGLLAMGTVGRRGWAGWLVGNTAERILGRTTCSLIVVKPPDFRVASLGD